MKHIVWKAYWDFEKEEKWLNEMSAKGLALSSYSWCRYVFEEKPRGEYIYRIELLDQFVSHPESQSYVRFLEETGIECVATYMRWAFFRKKASDGAFDLYSDIDSQIAYLRKVNVFWLTFMFIELMLGISNIVRVLDQIIQGEVVPFGHLFVGVLVLFVAVSFYLLGRKIRKKIKQLKREKIVHE